MPTIVVGAIAAMSVAGCGGGASRDPAPQVGAPPSAGDASTPLTAPGRAQDPTFTPLAGARAGYGMLGNAAYQIEIPEQWNGRLVMWMHGFQQLAARPNVAPPDFRRYLIAHGYAWAASSFSSTSLIPGRAADETAALWDHFVRTHRRPDLTIVSGESMGGWATHIAAERYGDRFDGALALCGAVGSEPALRISTEVLVAAAFVAGVTQADVDEAADLGDLFEERIRPALADPVRHERFERLLVALTGGPRLGDRAGLHLEEETNFQRALLLAATRLTPPRTTPYRLAPGAGVTDEEFNRAAIHLPADPVAQQTYWNGTEVTGRLAMPLLAMHTTGDGQVPIDQAQLLQQRVAAAGASRLLVERVVKDANHCGFRGAEQEAAFAALVHWVERGQRPTGTDLSTSDLRRLAPTFELGPPRPGSAADPAARRSRATIHGLATLDGKAFDARWVGAAIADHGLVTPCQPALAPIRQGRFELVVRSAKEALGCGRPGAQILLWTYVDRKLFAARPIPWPPPEGTPVTVAFNRKSPLGASPQTTDFAGQAYRTSGARFGPGSRVEALIGETLCGHATVDESGYFVLSAVGPDQIPGCRSGAKIRFRVENSPATETAPNRPGENHLDLTVQ